MIDVRFRVAAALAVVAALIAGCSGQSADGGGLDGDLTFVAYGGTTQSNVVDVFVRPFTQEEGLGLVEDNTDAARLHSMHEAGAMAWDIVNLEPWYSASACADGVAAPIPAEVVAELPDAFHGDCWAAPWSFSFVLAYRDDLDPAPTSWADFFDLETYPGRRGMWSWYQGGQFEAAMLGAGVARDAVYPLDLEVASGQLAGIMDSVTISDSLEETVQQIVSGEIDMGIVLSGRAAAQISSGAPISIVWDGQILAPDSYMVPANGPNPDAAFGLLSYMIDRDRLIEFAKVQFYGPAMESAQAALESEAECDLINTCGGKLDTAVIADTGYWLENEADVSAAWDAVLGR